MGLPLLYYRRNKMADNYLTSSDVEYLEKLKLWLRSSMEFTVLDVAPSEDDLIFLVKELPVWLSGKPPKNRFVTLGEMVKLCEDAASNKMIYEAWVNSALNNVYSALRALNIDDGNRLIAFFKTYHGLGDVDEDEMENEAREAIREAQQALYGDMY